MTQSIYDFPALWASRTQIRLAEGAKEPDNIDRDKAIRLLHSRPAIVLNAPMLAHWLGLDEIPTLDILELFTFVLPGQYCTPSVEGLSRALEITPPDDPAQGLYTIAQTLLDICNSSSWRQRDGAYDCLRLLAQHRWPWVPYLNESIRKPQAGQSPLFDNLKTWEDGPPPGKPLSVMLNESDVLKRLTQLVHKPVRHAGQTWSSIREVRPGQQNFARATLHSFRPRDDQGPKMLLANAGTGIGKTLGYLAPTSLWTQESNGQVIISTFTKALQSQLDRELDRVYPSKGAKEEHIAIRKGRENYLCLLNLEDTLFGAGSTKNGIMAGLVWRWASYTRDGDLSGSDFPSWIGSLYGKGRLSALSDRRGECHYGACPHYRRCFIEHANRRAEHAQILVVNHALMMTIALNSRLNSSARLIFDEGHHLFQAADSAFASSLSGRELQILRHWVLGVERQNSTRRRGLAARLADFAKADEQGIALLENLETIVQDHLPMEDWIRRLSQHRGKNTVETFLSGLADYVFACHRGQSDEDQGYSLEAEVITPSTTLLKDAQKLRTVLCAIAENFEALALRIASLLEERSEWMDNNIITRLTAGKEALQSRCQIIETWIDQIDNLGQEAPEAMMEWAAVRRIDGRIVDIGHYRHWIDPSLPLAQKLLQPAAGILVTSATLCDQHLQKEPDWEMARATSGAAHLDGEVRTFDTPSPFDYANMAQIIIVKDVRRGNIESLAHSYQKIIEAAQGGVLGLFTAIARLRAVYGHIADKLDFQNLPLYAQHIHPMDTGMLVEMFRSDPHCSLLGTDALRDGVDVPGETLRCVVMESVPWSRATIAHRHRKKAFGGSLYEDRQARLRLAQAFGRLIRKQGDRGCFVLLGSQTPSRLLSAFPAEIPIQRLLLEDALEVIARTCAIQK